MTLLLALLLTAAAVTPPVPLDTPPALSPTGAAPGEVVLLVTIGVDGAVMDASVVSSGGEALDGAALAAVRHWKFRPALEDGQPVESRVRIPFRFAAAAAPAAPPAAPAPPAPASPAPVEVTVRGRQSKVQRGASDFTIDVGSMAVVPRKNAQELLLLAPGFYLANEGGDCHAEQIFLRGFDASNAVELSVGGMPINDVDNPDAHGYADTHFIIPEAVQEVRVIEGPFDPHQGDFAEAGSADYVLGAPQRGIRLEGKAGSFGTLRSLALWAPPGERTGTFGAVQLSRTDGYGANRAGQNASAMAQYEGELGSRGIFRLLASTYAAHCRSAGVLPVDAVDRGLVNFYGTLDSSQGTDSTRHSLSFDLESPLGNGVVTEQTFLSLHSVRIVENFTGFLLDDQQIGQSIHPQRGDAVEKDYQAITAGARGAYRLRFPLLGRESAFEAGLYARYDNTQPGIERLRFGTQIPYAVDEDLETTVVNAAGYLDVDLRPLPFLTLRGGLRQESFTYSVLDRCNTAGNFKTGQPLDVNCPAFDRAGPRLPSRRVSATGQLLEPKGTVLVALPEQLTLSASAGLGARSLDPVSVEQDENAPFVKLTAYEAGVLARRRIGSFETTARLMGFQTKLDADLIFDQSLGRQAPSSSTTRTGFVAAFSARSPFLSEEASFTATHPVFDSDGSLVPYVPLVLARSDTAALWPLPGPGIAGHPLTAEAGLGVVYVGKRPLPLGQFADPTAELDASAYLRWRAVRIGVEVMNLFDNRFPLSEFFYASDFHTRAYATLAPTEHFTAAPPRTVLFNLTLLLDQEGE